MYGWMWARLPGPLPLRLLTVLIAIAAIVLILFVFVFPALSPHLPFSNVTVDNAPTPAPN
jgi:uncharacterized membrane protein YjfL (UPF0719 family)